jgi:hypothetical protein
VKNQGAARRPMEPTPGSAPIMPGRYVSAKRLSDVRGNFDALRHNSKRLLRLCKPFGARVLRT